MGFTGETGGKVYLFFFFKSLMDLLLKLDLIESNGVKEVRDTRRSAAVMIQEVLGLLEICAVKRQEKYIESESAVNDIGEVDRCCGGDEGSNEEEEEAMTDEIAEHGETVSDGDGEQDKTS